MLNFGDYNKGLIYTETKDCFDCNKCIHVCPTLKSNVVMMDENKYTMCVDDKECNLCGACLDTCMHDARHYKDDCNTFFADLKQGKPLSLLVAPSFYLNYPNQYKNVLGYLKSLGLKTVYPVAFGAKIAVWGYLNYISKSTVYGNIAQPCPSVVRYIERHLPSLLPNLIPIQSPMMCSAIYLKNCKNVQEELAFLSPCIAKKVEIESKRGLGLIGYNVTFKNLMKYIKEQKIDLDNYAEFFDDEGDCAFNNLGQLLPNPGGLKENIEYYLGQKTTVFQIAGERKVHERLKSFDRHIKKQAKKSNLSDNPAPMIVDILNCDMGCAYGTGTEFRYNDEVDIAYQALAMRKTIYESVKEQGGSYEPAINFEKLNETFKDLNIEHFMCEYQNDSIEEQLIITEEKIEEVYRDKLQKYTKNDRIIGCSACGYENCRQMAEAIAYGINHQNNCFYRISSSLKKRMEELLRTKEMLYTIIDNMPLCVNMTDKNFNVVECNKETLQMFDLKDKQEFNEKFLSFWPEYQLDGQKSVEKSKQMNIKALEMGQAYFEWIFKKPDGEIIPCEIVLMRVELSGELYVLAFTKDLREQQEMLAKLETALDREQMANSAKSQFLSNMSHEIRTPLNAIIGMTDMAKGSSDPSKKDYCIDIVKNASKHLLRIVNQVLDLSKIEANKVRLDYKTFELEKVMREVISVLYNSLEEKSIDLVVQFDESLPKFIILDDLRFAQIITNLLSNAIKFTPYKGTITVSTSYFCKTENILSIAIADTGIGISQEQQTRLFDAFEQAEAGTTRKYGGTGLGLVISKRIVDMMEGNILVESTLGMGSTFTVNLPFKYDDSNDDTVSDTQSPETKHRSYKGRTILLVEDVDINREIALAMLEQTEMEIDCAENGLQALQMFKMSPERYDLIFMDLQMPEMDGFTATSRIRELDIEKAKNIPIIAMTANVFKEDIDKCLEIGMDDHLGKPLDLDLVMKKINSYIPS